MNLVTKDGAAGNATEQLQNLQSLVKRMNDQRHRVKDAVGEEVRQSGVPLAPELKGRLLELSLQDAFEVLELHSGYKSKQVLDSVGFALTLFRMSTKEFFKKIGDYECIVQERGYFDHVNRSYERMVSFSIMKSVYDVSYYAKVLIDQSRRLKALVEVDEYDSKRIELFSDGGLSDFIVELRNMTSHELIIPHDASISFSAGSPVSQIYFSKKKLLKFKWNKKSLVFLNRLGEKVDIVDTYRRYCSSVESFYLWWFAAIEKIKPASLCEYEELMYGLRALDFNSNYKLLVSVCINNNIDPYKHLDKYLQEDTLAEVLKLPACSTEQVDKVIECIDEHRYCDMALRKMLYRLFRVA